MKKKSVVQGNLLVVFNRSVGKISQKEMKTKGTTCRSWDSNLRFTCVLYCATAATVPTTTFLGIFCACLVFGTGTVSGSTSRGRGGTPLLSDGIT